MLDNQWKQFIRFKQVLGYALLLVVLLVAEGNTSAFWPMKVVGIKENPVTANNFQPGDRAIKKSKTHHQLNSDNATRKNDNRIQNIDLAIVGGSIVTMDQQYRLIEDGYIAVKGSRIVDIGSRSDLMAKYRPQQTVNAGGRAIIPGLINTHTHIPMVLFRGIADDLALQEWLEKYIFPAEAKNVSAEFCYWGTLAGCLEMLRGGITTYVDMYYFEDQIAEATAKAGMRAVLGETLIDFPVPDNKTPQDALDYTARFVEKWKGHALITPAIAPHAPYTVKPENLKAAQQFADQYDVPLLTHLAETTTEVTDITNRYGARPVAHLDKLGLLTPRLVAAHVIHVNDAEIKLLQQRNVGVAHNPQSNLKLAAGIAPVPSMLQAHVAVGLGTDGAASNNDLNLFEEMDTAAKIHKTNGQNPQLVSAREALTMATIGGARAIHRDKDLGSLEIGKLADLVIVNLSSSHQQPVYNLYSTLVYATKSDDVETAIINGRIVMRQGRVLTINTSIVQQKVKQYRQQILQSLP
jgi:5-methylthioadenosine/S-adenosylhomocysteine deaminase